MSGALYTPEGLDIPDLVKFMNKDDEVKFLKNYNKNKGTKFISNQDLFELNVDVLIPAALENQIDSDNADKIKADIIVEGLNGPVTNQADDILNEKDVYVLPDILANSGGVIVSYFEWVQGVQSFFWGINEVNDNLRDIMLKSFADVWNISKKKEKHH
ncbi:MAG: hypothetical protein V5A68_04765 [Candidatus Thermoplasmatota archaeon]